MYAVLRTIPIITVACLWNTTSTRNAGSNPVRERMQVFIFVLCMLCYAVCSEAFTWAHIPFEESSWACERIKYFSIEETTTGEKPYTRLAEGKWCQSPVLLRMHVNMTLMTEQTTWVQVRWFRWQNWNFTTTRLTCFHTCNTYFNLSHTWNEFPEHSNYVIVISEYSINILPWRPILTLWLITTTTVVVTHR